MIHLNYLTVKIITTVLFFLLLIGKFNERIKEQTKNI